MLIGAGEENTRIGGDSSLLSDRVFEILPATQVTISGVTIQKGRTPFFPDPHPGFGGGIYSRGNVTLINSTVTDNSAVSGGSGVHNQIGPGEIRSTNSIVAANGVENCSGAFVSNGHNLSDDTTCFPATETDLVAAVLLAPLADNGGPTSTHLPLAGSPAIDAGDAAACPIADQRGAFRPQDGDQPPDGFANCDIGAVEVGLVPEPSPLLQQLTGLSFLLVLGHRRRPVHRHL